jgi:hypothetical protein
VVEGGGGWWRVVEGGRGWWVGGGRWEVEATGVGAGALGGALMGSGPRTGEAIWSLPNVSQDLASTAHSLAVGCRL